MTIYRNNRRWMHFEENAVKKARETAALSGYTCLADDSGLVVDALEGARYLLSPLPDLKPVIMKTMKTTGPDEDIEVGNGRPDLFVL